MTATDDERGLAAAGWHARLHSRTVSNAQLAEFARWRRDPANEAAYRAVETIWNASGELGGDPEVAAFLRHARLRRDPAGFGRSAGARVLIAGGLTAVLAILLVVAPRSNPPESDPSAYRTAVGERSRAVLSDGSSVSIDTDTIFTAQMAKEGRRVELRRGQAFFEVHPDARRPFVVSAGNGVTVTAVGTRFDVRRVRDVVQVSLEEGVVQVATATRAVATLRAGQSVEVTPSGAIRPLDAPVVQLLSWRQARLAFRSTRLVDAVYEINRYTTQPIVILDGGRGRALVSGDFSVDDPEGFVSAVNSLFGARTVVRSKTAPDDE